MNKILTSIILLLGTFVFSNAQHFVPVWTGNGYNHMNIYLTEATIDGVSVQIGDEIGVFDGTVCVGVGVITVNTADYLEIRVSQDDPVTGPVDGFTPANPINFKIWDKSETFEYQSVDIQVTTVSGSVSFSGGTTSVFKLEVDNNYPPIAHAGPSQIVMEGDLVLLDGTDSFDPDGDVLTYKWTVPADIALSSATASNPSFTAPEVPQDKIYTIFLEVSDAEFTSELDSVKIIVKHENKKPVINGLVSALDVDEDSELVFTLDLLDVDDPDNDPLQLEIFGGENYNLIGNIIKPIQNFNGTINVPVRVTDGMMYSNVLEVLVTVNPVNDAPHFLTQPVKEVLEGYTYNYKAFVKDADVDDNLTFAVPVKPDWLSFSVDGDTLILTGTPQSADAGEHNVTITCNDGTITIDQVFKILVTAIGEAPEAITPYLEAAIENKLYSQIVEFVDFDSEDLIIKLESAPDWLSIKNSVDNEITVPITNNEASIELTGTPTSDDIGRYQVILGFTDNVYLRSKMYILEVEYDNQAPVANNMTVNLLEDHAKLITLDGTDVETPDEISFSIVADPSNGTLEKKAANVYKYVPDPNYFGTDEFIYQVSENLTDLYSQGTVTLNVANVNDAPILASDQPIFVLDENTVLDMTGNLVVSDSLDKPNEEQTLDLYTTFGPFNGVFDPLAQTYTPYANFVGNDVLFLQVKETTTDPILLSEELKLQLKVQNVNSAPVAYSRDVFVKEDRIRKFVLFALDKEDDFIDLIYEIVDYPDHGVVAMNYNIAQYTPELNFNELDSFTFRVRDLDGAWSDTAQVNIQYIEINDRPIAQHDTIDADGNEFVTLDFSDLVTDPDSPEEDLQIQFLFRNPDFTGSGIFESKITQVGTLTYSYQDLNNSPFDYVVYRAFDGQRKSPPRVLFISGLSTAKASAPELSTLIAKGDSVATNYGDSLKVYFTGIATDLDNDLDLTIVDQLGLNGTLEDITIEDQTLGMPLVVFSAWYFPPEPSTIKGNDTEVVFDKVAFKTAKKLAGKAEPEESNVDTVYITNLASDLPPELSTISDQTIDEDNVLTLDVNYADFDTPQGDLIWEVKDQEGTVLATVPSSLSSSVATFEINPGSNFAGSIMLSVKVTDLESQFDTEDFNLTVTAINDAPVIQAIADQGVTLNSTFIMPIAYEDVDSDEADLEFSMTANPAEAVESYSFVDNQLNLTLVSDRRESVEITVNLYDGEFTDTEMFTLNVITDNSAPEYGAVQSLVINEDISGDILFTPTDIDGDNIKITEITSNNPALIPVENLTYSIAETASGVQKSIGITPLSDKYGSAILTVYLSDGVLLSVQEVELTVNAVNDLPVLGTIADLEMVRGTTQSIPLSASDVDSYEFSYGAASDETDLGVSVLGNQLTILPIATFYGVANVTVTVTDDSSGVDTQVFMVSVLNNEAFVTSTTYTVNDTENSITNVPANAALSDFKTNITQAANSVFEVYEADGTTVATDLQTGYKLIVTAEDGVTTKSYTITLNTGIIELSDVEVNLYPNPTSGLFNLSVKNRKGTEIHFEILNIIGQTILEKELPFGEYVETVDLSDNPTGIYMVKLYHENQVMLVKLIVE